MIGLSFDKVLVLLILAAFFIGPSRLPAAAEQLGCLVKMVKRSVNGAKASLRDTGGPDLDDIDWIKLDPRQYDPRRIIRDALADSSDGSRAPSRREQPTTDGVETAIEKPGGTES